MRKDVILAKARKNGSKERPVAILGYLLTAGNATVAECEEELKMNRRTLQSDLKLLVEKALAREVGTSPTDPPNTTNRYGVMVRTTLPTSCGSLSRTTSESMISAQPMRHA